MEFFIDYDTHRWSNDDVYDKYTEIIYQRIADLEAKLAESESKAYTLESYNKFSNNQCKKLIKENKQLIKALNGEVFINYKVPMENAQLKQQLAQAKMNESFEKEKKDNAFKLIEELKQQLAEKDKEIEKITRIVAYRDDMDRSTTINGVKFTNEQIITLQNIDYFADKHNQDKISFAVEKLEKVKDHYRQFKNTNMGIIKRADIVLFIDNQIEELKKEMK